MLDAYNHVSNIEYVRLMQDVAVEHSDSVGCTRLTEEMNCAWFVRSRTIEYKRPAITGDVLEITTWIDSTDLLRSTRKYRFAKLGSDTTLAIAETTWILVDVVSGRPRRIPEELIRLFWDDTKV